MPQAENTALARSHSSITTRKTILGSRQQCFWNEGKKKTRKEVTNFNFIVVFCKPQQHKGNSAALHANQSKRDSEKFKRNSEH